MTLCVWGLRGLPGRGLEPGLGAWLSVRMGGRQVARLQGCQYVHFLGWLLATGAGGGDYLCVDCPPGRACEHVRLAAAGRKAGWQPLTCAVPRVPPQVVPLHARGRRPGHQLDDVVRTRVMSSKLACSHDWLNRAPSSCASMPHAGAAETRAGVARAQAERGQVRAGPVELHPAAHQLLPGAPNPSPSPASCTASPGHRSLSVLGNRAACAQSPRMLHTRVISK